MADMKETKYLYHYYESTVAPFLSYADLSYDEALAMIKMQLERDPHNVNPRPEWFINRRREMESYYLGYFNTSCLFCQVR